MYKCCDITDSKFLLFTQLDLLEEIYISIILYITRLVCFAWVVEDKKEPWSHRVRRQFAPKRGRFENVAKVTEQRKKLVVDKQGTWRACRQCGWVRKIPIGYLLLSMYSFILKHVMQITLDLSVLYDLSISWFVHVHNYGFM